MDGKSGGGTVWKYAAAGLGGFVLGFGAGFVTNDMMREQEQAQKQPAAK